MSSTGSLASIIATAVGMILTHEAKRLPCGQWFIINHNSDDEIDTLAGFLNLPYDDFILLFEEAGLFTMSTSSQATRICFNPTNMIAILADVDMHSNLIEVTQSRVTSTLLPIKKYHAMRIGPKKFPHPETLQQQIKRAPTKRGKAIKEYQTVLRNLVDEVKAARDTQHSTQQNLKSDDPQTPPPVKSHSLQDAESQDTESHDEGSYQQSARPYEMKFTPTKQQSIGGALPIHDDLDLQKLCPSLLRAGFTFDTDYWISIIQREISALVQKVKYVCLNVFKAANSKLQTQVVVPQSANYESFRVSSS